MLDLCSEPAHSAGVVVPSDLVHGTRVPQGRLTTRASRRPNTHSALRRPEFESAVRAALRHYVRSDLLAENPLMRSRLLAKDAPGAPAPLALKTLLAETAEGLFANARDARFYRVVDLTYFNPAQKQEIVAQQLGLSFSTYRRHLATATDRLTGWLSTGAGGWATATPRPRNCGLAAPSLRGHLAISQFIGGIKRRLSG
jgi:hypothetical protein